MTPTQLPDYFWGRTAYSRRAARKYCWEHLWWPEYLQEETVEEVDMRCLQIPLWFWERATLCRGTIKNVAWDSLWWPERLSVEED